MLLKFNKSHMCHKQILEGQSDEMEGAAGIVDVFWLSQTEIEQQEVVCWRKVAPGWLQI